MNALSPYLFDMARGKGDKLPGTSFLARCWTAQQMNNLMGCGTFTAWNVQAIPELDLWELNTTLAWLEQLKRDHNEHT